MTAKRQCKFRDCERDAARGSTTCVKHRTAGISLKHWDRMQTARAERETYVNARGETVEPTATGKRGRPHQ